MKALTLDQPYANLVADRVKRIETRSWPAPRGTVGQWVAIHASKRRDRGVRNAIEHFYPEYHVPVPNRDHMDRFRPSVVAYRRDGTRVCRSFVLGAVVAVARISYTAEVLSLHGRASMEPRAEWKLSHAHIRVRDDPGLPGPAGKAWVLVTAYGDYTPGRWLWAFDRICPTAPMYCRGYQRVWNWTPPDGFSLDAVTEPR